MCALLFVYRFFNVWKTTIEDIVGKMKCETIERNVSIHKYDANKTNISSMQFGWNSSIRAKYIYLTFLPYFQIPLSICNVQRKMRQGVVYLQLKMSRRRNIICIPFETKNANDE